MPTLAHEAPLALLREAPALLPELLHEALGVEVPRFARAEVLDADLSQPLPVELRADLVICLRGAELDAPVAMGFVVEVQRHPDERKRFTWPLYGAALHARLERPVAVVVIATDDATARWAARPVDSYQPHAPFAPLVLGPAQIPRVDAERARQAPWLAALAALAHGNRPGGVEVALAAIGGLETLSDEHATLLFDLIHASLDDAARRALEDAMQPSKYPYQSEFARRYFGAGEAKGREEGRVEAARTVVLELLARRVPTLTADLRARVEACDDADRLTRLAIEVGATDDPGAIAGLLDGL